MADDYLPLGDVAFQECQRCFLVVARPESHRPYCPARYYGTDLTPEEVRIESYGERAVGVLHHRSGLMETYLSVPGYKTMTRNDLLRVMLGKLEARLREQ